MGFNSGLKGLKADNRALL